MLITTETNDTHRAINVGMVCSYKDWSNFYTEFNLIALFHPTCLTEKTRADLQD